MADALANPENRRYKQGIIDAIVAVGELESGRAAPEHLQNMLDSLPGHWDQSAESAYITGFSDMYALIAESLSIEYAPEAEMTQKSSEKAVEGPK